MSKHRSKADEMGLPTPDEMARAIWLGAAIKKVRDPETGRVIALKIVWPGWPGGRNPYVEAALEGDA